ncbi:MAG: hypothetical protein BGP20_06925 [Thiobacillus sp. 63-78]|nr:MAG: hypothetical protein BGP20_06925 [Thiobacillus sp. 63-78]
MSRSAVSGEHLVMAAHLLLVSLPSKLSSRWFSSFTCRSFSGVPAQRCQKRALTSTVSSVVCALLMARLSVPRNHDSQ